MTQTLRALDVVSLTEIAHRVGVTNAAVANWAVRHPDFPEPGRVLRCGSLWEWAPVAAWLTANDKPAHDVEPLPPIAVTAAAAAAAVNRRQWPAIAEAVGVSVRELGRAVMQVETGEPFGWFTRQRRNQEASNPQ